MLVSENVDVGMRWEAKGRAEWQTVTRGKTAARAKSRVAKTIQDDIVCSRRCPCGGHSSTLHSRLHFPLTRSVCCTCCVVALSPAGGPLQALILGVLYPM